MIQSQICRRVGSDEMRFIVAMEQVVRRAEREGGSGQNAFGVSFAWTCMCLLMHCARQSCLVDLVSTLLSGR